MRSLDGSAGDANYGAIGRGYAIYRQPEPLIGLRISEALANAQTVLNVGAGAGSYEPVDRQVVAVEPSASMRAQRPPHLACAIDAVAEELPFADRHFDASMATFTIHQWHDLTAGLREMRRVTRGPLVVLTCDPNEVQNFWLNQYAPQVLATEARRYPSTGSKKSWERGPHRSRCRSPWLAGTASTRPTMAALRCFWTRVRARPARHGVSSMKRRLVPI